MNFEHIVIIRNPVSTHAERAAKYITQIRAHFPNAEVTVLETVRGGIEANEECLRPHAELFGPMTLLGVVAGDGTFNMIATIILSISNKASQTTMIPLWGGNANDLAHMLSGRAPRSVPAVLRRVRPVAVRPLECRLTLPDGSKETRLAVCYVSFGASAAATRRLGEAIRSDHPSHVVPGVRFVREVGSIWRSLKRAPQFDIVQNGSAQMMFECMFLNGPRLAKVGGAPVRLADGHFHGAFMREKSLARYGVVLVLMHRRRHAHRFARTNVSFTVTNDTWAQFDGETVAIVAGTEVRITLAETPLTLLALRS